MKLTLITLVFILTPIALSAQTDAMPPETAAPASSSSSSQSPANLMPMSAKPTIAPSKELTVVTNTQELPLVPRTFTVAMLKALPQQTVTAVDGHTHTTSTFTGPLVADVFGATGLASDDKTHSLILRGFVIAEGTDRYRVVYSMAELEPTFSSGKVIVALTRDGSPIASGLQLVGNLDVKPARWVQAIHILAFSAVPLSK